MDKINFKVEIKSLIPFYQQIVYQIKRNIVFGVIKEGDKLPTHKELANQLKVHKKTVALAYNILKKEKIIYGHQGKGLFIENQIKEKLRIELYDYTKIKTKNILKDLKSLGFNNVKINKFIIEVENAL